MAFDAMKEAVNFSMPDADGRVIFHAPACTLTLHFTWSVIRELQRLYAVEDNPNVYLQVVSKGIDELEIEKLAEIVALASSRTYEEIMELNLPIFKLQQATAIAWSFAWHGGEPAEEADQVEKTKPREMSLLKRVRQAFALVFRGENSTD